MFIVGANLGRNIEIGEDGAGLIRFGGDGETVDIWLRTILDGVVRLFRTLE